MVNLASTKTFEIVEKILEAKKFTQYRFSKDLKGISFGLINKVTNWLVSNQFIARNEKEYVLKDPAGIVSAIAIYRAMEPIKLLEIKTSLSKTELVKLVGNQGIFCMDTALDQYTNYYKSDRVCAYVSKNRANETKKELQFKPGNKSVLCLYNELPKVKPKIINKKNFTCKVCTVIDMVCDGKAFATEPLFKELWGQKLG